MSSQKNYPYMFTHPWHIMNTRHCSGFFSLFCIVKTQRNSTQLNSTLKQLALELDIVVTCSTTNHPPPPPQTFRPLLDQLESWNLAQTLTRPIWLRKHNFNPTNYWGGATNPSPRVNPYQSFWDKNSFKITNNNSTRF